MNNTPVSVTIGGEEIKLLLNLGAFRLAKLKGLEFDFEALNSDGMESLDSLIDLAWISSLPYNPSLSHEDFVAKVALAGDDATLINAMLDMVSQFGEAMQNINTSGAAEKKQIAEPV